MVVVAILAFGLAMGADPRRLAVLAAVVYAPWLAVLGAIPLYFTGVKATDTGPALFCDGVAAELRAGSSVTEAVVASAEAVGAAEIGAAAAVGDLSEAGVRAGVAFPAMARELAVTIPRAGRSGSAASDLFAELAALALAQEEIRREVRVAAAPARAATALFLIVPLGFVVSRVASGNLSALVATGVQQFMVAGGLALFLTGLALAVALVWRVR